MELGTISNANNLITRLTTIGDVVVYILVSLGVIYIVYAAVMFMIKGKEGDENRHQALMQVVWGIVGLAIVLSIWGLVNLLINTFDTGNRVPTQRIPSANFVRDRAGSESVNNF